MTDTQTVDLSKFYATAETWRKGAYRVDNTRLANDIRLLAEENDLSAIDVSEILLQMITSFVSEPTNVFENFPEYIRPIESSRVVSLDSTPTQSSHEFFAVIEARASRRDYGPEPLDRDLMCALLQWTFGIRGTTLAYDFRDAPLRYVASAGGLSSCDAYVIVNRVDGVEPGSYYFDAEEGFKLLARGTMLPYLALILPDQAWLTEAAILVVAVTNLDRLAGKYGEMAAKLSLLDVGVALGHLELVSTALELRAAILGALPIAELRNALCLDDLRRIPIASIAIGTRGHFHG